MRLLHWFLFPGKNALRLGKLVSGCSTGPSDLQDLTIAFLVVASLQNIGQV